MAIESRAKDGEIRVAFAGELTLACAQQLRADLLHSLESGAPVVLDLERVTEIDLACLQVVAAAQCSFSARGRPLRILWAQSVAQTWNDAGYPQGSATWQRQS